MSDYDIVIFFVGLLSYFAAVVQGVTTFGDNIVFHIVWRLAVIAVPAVMHSTPLGANDLELVVMMLSVRAGFTQPYFAFLSRKHRKTELLPITIPAVLTTLLLGTAILRDHAGSPWIRWMLGVFFGGAAIILGTLEIRKIFFKHNAAPPSTSDDFVFERKHKIALLFASLAAGIFGGMSNVINPPFMVFKLVFNVPNRAMRSFLPPTMGLCFAIRFVYLLFTGGYDPRCWMAYVAVVTGGFAGLFVGTFISEGSSVTPEFIAFSVCWLMMLAALALGEVPAVVTVVACVLCIISMALFPTAMRRRRATLEAAKAQEEASRPSELTAASPETEEPTSPLDLSPPMSPNEAIVQKYSS
jgi:hypothetical protein